MSKIKFKKYTENWIIDDLDKYIELNSDSLKLNSNKNLKDNFILAQDIEKYVTPVGNVPILTTGNFTGFTNETIAEKIMLNGEVITLPSGGVANIKYCKGNFVNSGNILISTKNGLNAKFLYYLLLKNIDTIQGLYRGVSIQHPDINEFRKIQINIPASANEQHDISQILTYLDKTIELYSAKYQKAKLIRQSLITYMFPDDSALKPRLRFKNFNDEWHNKKLGNIAEIKRGLTYTPNDVSQSGVKVLRSSNIKNSYFVEFDDDVFVCPNAINIPFSKEHDILVTAANGSSELVGKHCVIENIESKKVVHGGFMLNVRYTYPYFLNSSMDAPWYKTFVATYAAGGNGAIGNLSKSILDSADIKIPSKNEQLCIDTFFNECDKLVKLYEKKTQLLIKIKKSLFDLIL